ncbi:ACP S-malonyltransferase [Paenibacillus sp. GbtcB18]|uniref:ACP S-malonyltransferase n=1 Tax=Paenibacillus sp. GbtcB18 TaxID=2824763 RepID=UPI001C2FCBF0|nr:ACP S-malonyltransferase [Paenibacillus sp. GbtcB18]
MLTYVFPGQGSQHVGMGISLFDEFKELVKNADDILGFSVKELCLEDSSARLNQTQFTQPAIYTVNVLSYLKKLNETGRKPDYVAGHSLGEYSALFAAGAYDFETGLKIVKNRGELMQRAKGGSMAAVIGLTKEQVDNILRENHFDGIDIANLNSPKQIVIAGNKELINRAKSIFEANEQVQLFSVLNVSGAFHSRYMSDAMSEFEIFIDRFAFSPLQIPVISNVFARPYVDSKLKETLVSQLTSSVNWTDSIRYLMGRGNMEFVEIGPGNVLKSLIRRIQAEAEALIINEENLDDGKIERRKMKSVPSFHVNKGSQTSNEADHHMKIVETPKIVPIDLGSSEFRKDYNLKYAYLSGGMYRGISSEELVIKMGKAGMMGFYGTGGKTLREIEKAIIQIQNSLTQNQAYGMNFIHHPYNLDHEEKIIELYLKYGIKVIEVAAFVTITPALVMYRAKGLKKDAFGNVIANNKIIAKVSRPEVAEGFLMPSPNRIVEKLLALNKITKDEAEMLVTVPIADDICVESDSGGHTDGGIAYTLMPAMIRLRDDMMAKYGYKKIIRVGAAGGIGTPSSAAAAFILGADFILTGSINQCTVEAGTSDAVKEMLQQINVQDTEYAPAGDMFELGAKVQVLKRGVFFPARANKLFELYRRHNSLNELDKQTKSQLEERYFKRSFEKVFEEVQKYKPESEIQKAEADPKLKMALIFKWYFAYTTQLALEGKEESKVDFQIHCGPALGAFNQWVKGTKLEDWKNRHVDTIGEKIMLETAEYLNYKISMLMKG